LHALSQRLQLGFPPSRERRFETLDVHLQPLRVPAVTGYSFGHIRNQFTMPVGIKGRLDTEARTVTLLEAAVS
jgi:muramoyltetrapeptide carboxypeptidase